MLKKRNLMPELLPTLKDLTVQSTVGGQLGKVVNCRVLSLLAQPSLVVNHQLKRILAEDDQPVLQLDEGDLRLTPVDFANQVSRQFANALAGVSAAAVARLVVIYAPSWAAECRLPADAQRIRIAHRQIRDVIQILYDRDTASHVQIIYGGFVFEDELATVLGDVNVDGVLIK